MRQEYKVKQGKPYPSGCKFNSKGVNFSIFSRYADIVELLLFASADCDEPFQIIPLQKETNRTFFSWHVYVSKLPAGTWYTWRMDGPNHARESGFRFEKRSIFWILGRVRSAINAGTAKPHASRATTLSRRCAVL